MTKKKYVCNPKSGRVIEVGGSRYRQIKKQPRWRQELLDSPQSSTKNKVKPCPKPPTNSPKRLYKPGRPHPRPLRADIRRMSEGCWPPSPGRKKSPKRKCKHWHEDLCKRGGCSRGKVCNLHKRGVKKHGTSWKKSGCGKSGDYIQRKRDEALESKHALSMGHCKFCTERMGRESPRRHPSCPDFKRRVWFREDDSGIGRDIKKKHKCERCKKKFSSTARLTRHRRACPFPPPYQHPRIIVIPRRTETGPPPDAGEASHYAFPPRPQPGAKRPQRGYGSPKAPGGRDEDLFVVKDFFPTNEGEVGSAEGEVQGRTNVLNGWEKTSGFNGGKGPFIFPDEGEGLTEQMKNTIALEGPVILYRPYNVADDYSHETFDEKGDVVIGKRTGTAYISFLTDPTWRAIADAAQQSITVTGNDVHIYPEQLEEIPKENLPESLKNAVRPVYYITMGS